MTETGPDLAHPALVARHTRDASRRRLPVARTCKRGLDIDPACRFPLG